MVFPGRRQRLLTLPFDEPKDALLPGGDHADLYDFMGEASGLPLASTVGARWPCRMHTAIRRGRNQQRNVDPAGSSSLPSSGPRPRWWVLYVFVGCLSGYPKATTDLDGAEAAHRKGPQPASHPMFGIFRTSHRGGAGIVFSMAVLPR